MLTKTPFNLIFFHTVVIYPQHFYKLKLLYSTHALSVLCAILCTIIFPGKLLVMLLRTVLEKTHEERSQNFKAKQQSLFEGEWRLGRGFVEVYYGTVWGTLAPLY